MIEAISIANVATYGNTPATLNSLAQLNFIYGANGTGKTTISRIIAEEDSFSSCHVGWKSGTKLQTIVYNQDFIERNFNQSTEELKGVFTLGEANVDTVKKLAISKVELNELTKKIESLTSQLQGTDGLGGKKAELAAIDVALKEKCWTAYTKHKDNLSSAFDGYRNDKSKFYNKVLQEKSSNKATLTTMLDLEQRAKTIFGSTPITESVVASIDPTTTLSHESNPILNKRVIGKDDVDIAGMIKKLGNSDWVRTGRSFYEINEKKCPFCQQVTNDAFATSLNEYFDETFIIDSQAIDDLVTNYKTDTERLQQQIADILSSASKFLDFEALKLEKELLDSKLALNSQKLIEKKKEPSQIIELESVSNVALAIKNLIDAANLKVAEHNKTVSNLTQERAKLTTQVWQYLLAVELKSELDAHTASSDGFTKAIASLTAQIVTTNAEKLTKESEIRTLEKQTTSTQPTIDSINILLSSFGFQGFKLAAATTPNSYKLIRANGTDAKATLSEGEKTFVTFLYFYHLLKGSNLDSGVLTNRVVVFDDPISSLDSDILFIVGSLIKGVFDEIRSKASVSHIKQVFVLTHNIYFFKEITFNPDRKSNKAMKEESFWIVHKRENETSLVNHSHNPIKTSYELLWAEVKDPNRSNLTIQNTLRRILENYFKILGGVNPDKICAMFDGKEKMICKSLFSWVNDGSHFAHDDLYVSDGLAIDVYLNVFKAIFDKSEHTAHYTMMMGDTQIAVSENAATA